jgi:HEAT repeat protein
MGCEEIRSLVADHLTGALAAGDAERVAAHLRGCAACAAEYEAAEETWRRLGVVRPPAPDSAAMRARFQALLAEHVPVTAPASSQPRRRATQHWLQAAAAVTLLVTGTVLGRLTAPAPAPDAQIADVRAELREMREMFTLSLLQQQSASARLKGITWTGQIDQPGTDIAAALLDTLRHDPNVPVRLASIDALTRFGTEAAVRRGALEALARETSPLVQIALIDFVVEAGDGSAAATLRRLADDGMVDASVRARAAQALEQLTGNRV